MKHRTERPPQLPRLTAAQLRQQLAAEEAGAKPDCFLCGQPVGDQTFKPSHAAGADADDRTLINAPCGHAMTYGLGLAEQVKGQMRLEAAAQAAGPEASSCPVGVLGAVASALEGQGVWIPEAARKAVAEAVVAAMEARVGVEHRCETTAADAVAAELHRRATRLEDFRKVKPSSCTFCPAVQVDGEVVGLRGALGIVLGGTVPGGNADQLGADYYQAWLSRAAGVEA